MDKILEYYNSSIWPMLLTMIAVILFTVVKISKRYKTENKIVTSKPNFSDFCYEYISEIIDESSFKGNFTNIQHARVWSANVTFRILIKSYRIRTGFNADVNNSNLWTISDNLTNRLLEVNKIRCTLNPEHK